MKNSTQIASQVVNFSKGIKRIRLIALSSLLFILILLNLFILDGLTFKQIAQAISSNYSKATGQQLSVAEWNNLPVDFVARTGGALSNMLGILDMGNNRITNLATPTVNSDATSKQYVDTAVAGAGGGGDIFTNWGQSTCPAGSAILYSGYAFNQRSNSYAGGGEPICLEYVIGDPPTLGAPVTPVSDALSPLSTADSGQLPPTMPARRIVQCAVCYRDSGTCFEHWGSQSCGGAVGFSPIYTGYGLGVFANRSTGNINRHCVDDLNFNGSIVSTVYNSVWYGTSIYDTTNVGLFTQSSYVKCAMCCN